LQTLQKKTNWVHSLGEVGGELVEDEDFLVEGPGEALVGQPHQFRLVLRKADALVQLVGGDDVGARGAPLATQERVQPLGQLSAGHDVHVRDEHVLCLAIATRQVAHVVLRVGQLDAPARRLGAPVAHQQTQRRLRLAAVETLFLHAPGHATLSRETRMVFRHRHVEAHLQGLLNFVFTLKMENFLTSLRATKCEFHCLVDNLGKLVESCISSIKVLMS
jgi:hypothetical protein